jgi:hypothetical protein
VRKLPDTAAHADLSKSTARWRAESADTAVNFLWLHRDFLWGVLAGSLLELAVVYASRWTWDRYLWLRWFSHQ